ncbi:hypothetical protein Hanom_Chr14g01312781 [Helianthus anomalus]
MPKGSKMWRCSSDFSYSYVPGRRSRWDDVRWWSASGGDGVHRSASGGNGVDTWRWSTRYTGSKGRFAWCTGGEGGRWWWSGRGGDGVDTWWRSSWYTGSKGRFAWCTGGDDGRWWRSGSGVGIRW